MPMSCCRSASAVSATHPETRQYPVGNISAAGLVCIRENNNPRLRVEVCGDTLMATGSLVVRHTDFGLTPVSVAGVVKVKNEIARTLPRLPSLLIAECLPLAAPSCRGRPAVWRLASKPSATPPPNVGRMRHAKLRQTRWSEAARGTSGGRLQPLPVRAREAPHASRSPIH